MERVILASPELEAFIDRPSKHNSFKGLNLAKMFLPWLAYGAQMFTLSTSQAAGLAVVAAGELGRCLPGLVLHIGAMVTLSVVEGTKARGFSGDMFDCTRWLRETVDTKNGPETIEDSLSREMALHLSFADYKENIAASIEHLVRRYETVFGARPAETFVLGSVAPSLVGPGAMPGPHPRMRQVSLGSRKVVVPATDYDTMHLEADGCMLYSDQDTPVARKLFRKTLNVFELD